MNSPQDDPAAGQSGVVDNSDLLVDDDGELLDLEAQPRGTGLLTKVLAGLLLVVLGFLGGVAVGRATAGGAAAGATSGTSGGSGGSSTGGSGAVGGTTGSDSGSVVSSAAPASPLNGPDVGGGSRTPAVAPPSVSFTQPTPGNTGGSGSSPTSAP